MGYRGAGTSIWSERLVRIVTRSVFIAVLGACLFVFGCGVERHERAALVMGTILEVTIEGLPSSEAEAAADAVFAEAERLNALMNSWDPESALSRLNREAVRGWAVADPEILVLLQISLGYSRLTGGAFDVTAGPLVRLWGFIAREVRVPPPQGEIEAAMAQTGFERVELDLELRSVRLQVEGMEIDFGGVAKGYAVDRAIAVLRERGVERALVNLGGNVRGLGSPAARERWTVAVRDPRISGERPRLLGYIGLGEGGIASSGQYERFFEHEGRRYGHIIDPRTGWPAEDVLGTTIVAPDALTADILSTAVFVLGPERGPEFIDAQEGIEGIVVLPRGDGGVIIRISEGLRPHFRLEASVTDADVEYF